MRQYDYRFCSKLIRRLKVFGCSALLILCGTSGLIAQERTTPADIEDLKTQIEALSARLDTLETEQQGREIAPPPQDPSGNLVGGDPVSSGDVPRSFRIPGTNISLRFGGYAKFDLIHDRGVMLAGARYFPDLIAIDGTPQAKLDGITQLTAAQTRFSLSAQAPSKLGILRVFIEMDFFAAGGNTRLRHAFGQAGPLLAGQAWSTLMDLYSLTPSVAITAPSGAIFARHSLIRYMPNTGNPNIQVAFALEGPKKDVTPLAATDIVLQRYPDFISTYKFSKGRRGHIQIGTILRRVGVKKTAGGESEVNGWGLTLTGRLSTIGRDSFGFGGVVGDGIGSYIAGLATSPASAGPTPAGELKAQRAIGGYAGYMRVWNAQFRSTVSYGYVQVDPTAGQPGTAVKNTQNFLSNIVFTPQRGVGIGLEYTYGRRENNNGTKGTNPRIHFGIQFGFS